MPLSFLCRMMLGSWKSYQVYPREGGEPIQALKGLLEWKGIKFRVSSNTKFTSKLAQNETQSQIPFHFWKIVLSIHAIDHFSMLQEKKPILITNTPR